MCAVNSNYCVQLRHFVLLGIKQYPTRLDATNIGFSIRLRPPQLHPGSRTAIPACASELARVVANSPGAAGRTSGTRIGRVRATLARRASICTTDTRPAPGPVSFYPYIPFAATL